MLIPVLIFLLLFVSNDLMDIFGTFAGNASAVFLVAQMVAVIDASYTSNELLYPC